MAPTSDLASSILHTPLEGALLNFCLTLVPEHVKTQVGRLHITGNIYMFMSHYLAIKQHKKQNCLKMGSNSL